MLANILEIHQNGRLGYIWNYMTARVSFFPPIFLSYRMSGNKTKRSSARL